VAATRSSLTDFENLVADMVLDTMRRTDTRASTDVYRDGLLNILHQPEFVHNDSAHQIVRALEERQFVEELIGEVMQQGGLQIIIGGEGRWEDLSEVSVVLARYGVASQATGTLGVLGPIRMQYGRTVSVVRYVSQLMSEMVSDLYGR
jgi:heat-inducible transcriptional repressor